MKVFEGWMGVGISGIRMKDKEGTVIAEVNLHQTGDWQTQIVPDGQEIIGLKSNTKGSAGD